MNSVENKGLTPAQAQKRLEKHGPNEINGSEGVAWLSVLIHQFKSPLIYILYFAATFSFFLGHSTDAGVILLAVVVNTALGFFQEFKAEKAVQALQGMVKPEAVVIRGGERKKIPSSQIVPKDIVVIKRGDSVPADGKIVDESDLYVNEAILTGESRSIDKNKGEEVYKGSTVVSGTAEMKVTATGQETKMGKMALKLEETTGQATPLKLQVQKLAKTLTIIIGILCLGVFLEGFIRGRDLADMFALVVSMAVAAIPEGLAISVTMVLALGMKRISKKKGLVRKLLAAETLGAVDVICLDKTGTLTEGKMRVVKVESEDKEIAGKILTSANSLVNSLDVAVWDWVKDQNFKGMSDWSQEATDQIPFAPERKFSAGKIDGQVYLYGAPELLIENGKLSEDEKSAWIEKLRQKTTEGYRAVAVGGTDSKYWQELRENSWEKVDLDFYGLVFLADPVRNQVKRSLISAKKAGIQLKVITGDYYTTAASVINKLELNHGPLEPSESMSGKSLAKISEEALAGKVDEIKLFYRTSPEQKLKIVKALQDKNHIVAMMGDGVNDALALKTADIGVVVGEATDVAKQTADMVLLDSNFSTIITAIEQGRVIFSNIKKVLVYLLSGSFTELMLIGTSLAFGLPIPVLPAQILWVNLFEDSLPGLSLAFEEGDHDILEQKPRSKDAKLLDKEVRTIIFAVGIVSDILLLGLFFVFLNLGLPIEKIRTMMFLSLAFDSLLFVFSTRDLKKNIWEYNPFSNMFLNLSVFVGFLFILIVTYLPFLNKIFSTVPLSASWLLIILGIGLTDLIGIELVKLKFKKNG